MTKKRLKTLIMIFLFVLNIFSTIKILYSLFLLHGIELIPRILISIILILLLIIFGFYFMKKYNDNKGYIKLIIITLIYTITLLIISNYIIKAYKMIDKITTDDTLYSTSLISLVENESYKLENIGSGDIGILNDTSSIDGNEIPNEVIKKKTI